MKDNKENLNNELSNEAAETVAGGAGKDWGFFQKRKLRRYVKKLYKEKGLSDEDVEPDLQRAINEFSPAELKEHEMGEGRLTDELKNILDSKW